MLKTVPQIGVRMHPSVCAYLTGKTERPPGLGWTAPLELTSRILKTEYSHLIAERLRENVSASDPGFVDKVQLPKVTISLGVAARQPKYSLDMMIAAADVAMYHAKRNGKNRFEIAAVVDADL